MQVWNVLHEAHWKIEDEKLGKKLPSLHHRTTLSGYIFATQNVGQCPTWWPPAQYRWRPLQRRKVWLTPTTRVPCSNASKTRNSLNLQGCAKLPNWSLPLIGRSSTYYEDMWGRYCCLTGFFPIVDTCFSSEDSAWQSCTMVPRLRFFCVLYFQRAACSTFQTCIRNSH